MAHSSSASARPSSPNEPRRRPWHVAIAWLRRSPKLFQAGLALFLLGVLVAFLAGMSRSPAVTTAAYGVMALAMLCLGASSCVETLVKPMLEERRDPDGVPAEVLDAVVGLALEAGIEVPRVKVIRSKSVNARVVFFRGWWLIINRGFCELRNPLALRGTVGHEIGHIVAGHLRWRRRVLPLTWLALAIAGVVLCGLWKANAVPIAWPAYAALAATGVWLPWARVSRRYEHEADRIGARLAGVAAQLAVLDEFERYAREHGHRPWLGKVGRLFSTHPTPAERKAALHSIEQDEEQR